jgi:hypothetical protein
VPVGGFPSLSAVHPLDWYEIMSIMAGQRHFS